MKIAMDKSLYSELKFKLFKVSRVGNREKYNESIEPVIKKSLLNDVKDGKNPEKKHKTLDHFFK